jgi:hypothetical protein
VTCAVELTDGGFEELLRAGLDSIPNDLPRAGIVARVDVT